MMILVTELVTDHRESFREVRKRELPGHPDPAVKLDVLLDDNRADAADRVLRRRCGASGPSMLTPNGTIRGACASAVSTSKM